MRISTYSRTHYCTKPFDSSNEKDQERFTIESKSENKKRTKKDENHRLPNILSNWTYAPTGWQNIVAKSKVGKSK